MLIIAWMLYEMMTMMMVQMVRVLLGTIYSLESIYVYIIGTPTLFSLFTLGVRAAFSWYSEYVFCRDRHYDIIK
jgi:hypothetical protein